MDRINVDENEEYQNLVISQIKGYLTHLFSLHRLYTKDKKEPGENKKRETRSQVNFKRSNSSINSTFTTMSLPNTPAKSVVTEKSVQVSQISDKKNYDLSKPMSKQDQLDLIKSLLKKNSALMPITKTYQTKKVLNKNQIEKLRKYRQYKEDNLKNNQFLGRVPKVVTLLDADL